MNRRWINLIGLFFILATTSIAVGCSTKPTPPPRVEEFPICTNASVQRLPAISGDKVVWEDLRDGTGWWFSSWGTIYCYDLSTYIESRISGTGERTAPAVSGAVVLWEQYCGGDFVWGPTHIYGYNLSDGSNYSIGSASVSQGSPIIAGDTVVWEESGSIHSYNLSSKKEDTVCNSSSLVDHAISGNVIVFVNGSMIDGLPHEGDIYGYNLATHTEFPICTNSSSQSSPAISGNIVAWVDDRNGNDDIYGYNLSTKQEFPICTNAGNQTSPAISGNTVVWVDDRNGNDDIYGARLTFDNP